MARVSISINALLGGYAGVGVASTFQAGDASLGNTFPMMGGEIVIARNVGVVSRTITMKSISDPFGRTGDLSEALAAGQYKVFGPFNTPGWRQSGADFWIDVSHADVEILVLRPNQ